MENEKDWNGEDGWVFVEEVWHHRDDWCRIVLEAVGNSFVSSV